MILTYIVIALEICFAMAHFIDLKEWFHVCYLNVCFVRVQR